MRYGGSLIVTAALACGGCGLLSADGPSSWAPTCDVLFADQMVWDAVGAAFGPLRGLMGLRDPGPLPLGWDSSSVELRMCAVSALDSGLCPVSDVGLQRHRMLRVDMRRYLPPRSLIGGEEAEEAAKRKLGPGDLQLDGSKAEPVEGVGDGSAAWWTGPPSTGPTRHLVFRVGAVDVSVELDGEDYRERPSSALGLDVRQDTPQLRESLRRGATGIATAVREFFLRGQDAAKGNPRIQRIPWSWGCPAPGGGVGSDV